MYCPRCGTPNHDSEPNCGNRGLLLGPIAQGPHGATSGGEPHPSYGREAGHGVEDGYGRRHDLIAGTLVINGL